MPRKATVDLLQKKGVTLYTLSNKWCNYVARRGEPHPGMADWVKMLRTLTWLNPPAWSIPSWREQRTWCEVPGSRSSQSHKMLSQGYISSNSSQTGKTCPPASPLWAMLGIPGYSSSGLSLLRGISMTQLPLCPVSNLDKVTGSLCWVWGLFSLLCHQCHIWGE